MSDGAITVTHYILRMVPVRDGTVRVQVEKR